MSVMAWPVQRQTYGYLPSHKASLPIGWYQIILLGDRGTCVLTTCPGSHSTAGRPGFKLVTYRSQVQLPNHSATEPHTIMMGKAKIDAVHQSNPIYTCGHIRACIMWKCTTLECFICVDDEIYWQLHSHAWLTFNGGAEFASNWFWQ